MSEFMQYGSGSKEREADNPVLLSTSEIYIFSRNLSSELLAIY